MGADERDVDGLTDRNGVRYVGKARRQPDGTWQALANVGGALCLVEVSIGADASHAAGYAEAVADIREMLKGKLPEQETLIGGMVLILVDEWLATGAHVGAAKKGGGA